MSKQVTPETEVITFAAVFKEIQHWRKHKKEYLRGAIPDELWGKIFILERQGEYSPSDLRRCLSLNKQQYTKKYQALMGQSSSEGKTISDSSKDNKESLPVINFSEAVVNQDINIPALKAAADETKKEIKVLKSTEAFDISTLDPTTVVVECIRVDGHRLKIHMTTQRPEVLMNTFFSQASTS